MWAPIERVWGFFAPPEFGKVLEFMELKDMNQVKEANKFLRALDHWGMKISLTFLVAAILFTLAVTPWGFVRAGDVDKKVEAATTAMKKDIEEVKVRLTTIEEQNMNTSSALNELLAQKVATDICRRLEQMRKEPDVAERRTIRTEIDSLQKRHQALDGELYPENRCQ